MASQVPKTTGIKSRFHALLRRLALFRASSTYPIACRSNANSAEPSSAQVSELPETIGV
jgi:hypothetical protein